MDDAAVPTKKKKNVPPDDAPIPHKYEAKKMDDGSIQYHAYESGLALIFASAPFLR